MVLVVHFLLGLRFRALGLPSGQENKRIGTSDVRIGIIG